MLGFMGQDEHGEPDALEQARNDQQPAAKPMWRRFFEVAAPVAVFAIAAPFAVNSLASAVNKTVPDTSTAAVESAVATASAPVETVTTTVDTTATTTAATTAATTPSTAAQETPVTVDIVGLADDADDKTISLATEIVAGTTASTEPSTPIDSEASPTTVAEASEDGHAHGGITAEVALTRGERKDLAAELSAAREASSTFATVADAEKYGYALVTGYLPLIGAHYIKWGLMDGDFDVAAPEMLLYDGTDPDSNLVGLSYYLFSETEPSPFTGANDHWHQHIGLCIKDGVVVGGSSTTQEQCAARGGSKAGASNGWMVHAWVVPGWESPQGVFSPEHIGLTAELPTS